MGLLDAASSTLGAIGGALTPGQLQTLLNQTIIPFTIVISRLYLGTEFNKNQIVGASLVFFGAGVAGLPYFFKDQSPFPDPYERADAGTVSISIAIFAVSVVPSAMSNVYKEKAMKGKDLDVYFTTTGISIWQELLGFLFLPLLRYGRVRKSDTAATRVTAATQQAAASSARNAMLECEHMRMAFFSDSPPLLTLLYPLSLSFKALGGLSSAEIQTQVSPLSSDTSSRALCSHKHTNFSGATATRASPAPTRLPPTTVPARPTCFWSTCSLTGA